MPNTIGPPCANQYSGPDETVSPSLPTVTLTPPGSESLPTCHHTYTVFLTRKYFSTTISLSADGAGRCQLGKGQTHLRQMGKVSDTQTYPSSKPPRRASKSPQPALCPLAGHLRLPLGESTLTFYKKNAILYQSLKLPSSQSIRWHKTGSNSL